MSADRALHGRQRGRERSWGSSEHRDDVARPLVDVEVGELEHDEAEGLQLVAAAGILGALGVAAVAPTPTDLDKERDGLEAEVDPRHGDAVPPVDPLAPRPGESGAAHQREELALEWAVAAGVDQQLVEQADSGAA
jgi:hypothetical protein